MENNFNNKKIIITGASRGIGFELVKLLIGTNASLILIASKDSSFDKIKEIVPNNKEVIYLAIDFSVNEEIKCIKNLLAPIGKIDFLINNAGIAVFKHFNELTIEDFENTINVNLKAPFELIRAVLPAMIESEEGSIINVLSVVAKKAFSNSSIYGASKAAFMHMAESLRAEVRDRKIKVVNLFPGATATEIWSPKALEKHSNRMMEAKDVAQTIFEVMKLSYINSILIEELQLRPQGGDL